LWRSLKFLAERLIKERQLCHAPAHGAPDPAHDAHGNGNHRARPPQTAIAVTG
jgi:hypothetical protein